MDRALRRSREYSGNKYTFIRDCVQQQKPFAIYNFTSSTQYNNFLNDLDSFGQLNYIVQTITLVNHGTTRTRMVFPSIFVTNVGTTIDLTTFKKIVKGSLKHYKLDSIVSLYDGAVSVFYKNGTHNPIGNTIYGSTHIDEFDTDFYQVDGTYYIFIS